MGGISLYILDSPWHPVLCTLWELNNCFIDEYLLTLLMNTYLIPGAALETLHNLFQAYTLSFILKILLERYYPYFTDGETEALADPLTHPRQYRY